MQLFVDRAQAARSGFALTEENAAAVAALCDQLEGLPLALELAAARASVATPEQMLTYLEQRFEFLVSRQRDIEARHRTLRATIDGSYQLLSPEPRQLFARLSVFRGGWTMEAAEAVCGKGGAGERLDLRGTALVDAIQQLCECSLVRLEDEPSTEAGSDPRTAAGSGSRGPGAGLRFRMLETLREYAWERLVEDGRMEEEQAQHAAWFLQLALRADSALSGPERRRWLDALTSEHDNMCAALRWSLENGRALPALRLAAALGRFWAGGHHLAEGREWLGAALALPAPAAPVLDEYRAVRSIALDRAGLLARIQEDRPAARAFWTESLAIRRELGDAPGAAEMLSGLGELHAAELNDGAAQACYQESLAIRRESGDRPGIARVLQLLGDLAAGKDPVAAQALYEEALALNREREDRLSQLGNLQGLSSLALERGDSRAAQTFQEEALAIQQERGDRWGSAGSLFTLGKVAFLQRDYSRARACWEETLALDMEKMKRGGRVLLWLGHLAAAEGDLSRARSLYEEFLLQQRRAGIQAGVTSALAALGDLAFREGDEIAAQASYEEGMATRQALSAREETLTLLYNLWYLARRRADPAATSLKQRIQELRCEPSNPLLTAWCCHYLGIIARYEGTLREAASCHEESMALFQELMHLRGLATCLEAWASLAAAHGPGAHAGGGERAARLCGAAERLREVAGDYRSPIEAADYEATVGRAQSELGSARFPAAWEEGRALSLQQALDYACTGKADRLG